MDASVVIPTYNKDIYLELTLESLWHQSCEKLRYEIIVIDDGSSDGTSTVIEQYAERDWNFQFIKQVHAGRSKARNSGIRVARGKIVIFVDDDCICSRNLVATHITRHAGTEKKAIVGLCRDVFTKVLDTRELLSSVLKGVMYDLDHLVAAESFERILPTIPDTFHFISVEDVAKNLTKIDLLSVLKDPAILDYFRAISESNFSCPWHFFLTGHASVERSALIQVGLFDEEFRGWGGEDPELGYRLFRTGIEFDAIQDAVVYHQIHPRNLKRRTKEVLHNYIKTAEKHKDPAIYLQWQLISEVISMQEYEATVRQIQAGLLSETEIGAIKSAYDRFVGNI